MGKWSKREIWGGFGPHSAQGEPHPLVRMGPYWMGHSSVKVTGFYRFHLLDFISPAAIPSAAWHKVQ
jgi:hypothetical protein